MSNNFMMRLTKCPICKEDGLGWSGCHKCGAMWCEDCGEHIEKKDKHGLQFCDKCSKKNVRLRDDVQEE
jgi:hypothetical protein